MTWVASYIAGGLLIYSFISLPSSFEDRQPGTFSGGTELISALMVRLVVPIALTDRAPDGVDWWGLYVRGLGAQAWLIFNL